MLAAKLAEYDKPLDAARAEVASLKETVARIDMEKAEYEKLVAQVREQSKQRMVHLNVALVGRKRTQKLARSLVTKFINAVNAVVQQLGYNAVSWLWRALERPYSTVRVPCTVALTRVSGVAATSMRWKGEESRDVRESKPAECHPTETRQGSVNLTCPQGSGKDRSVRH